MTTELTHAVLMALDRDASKAFFGRRDDAGRMDFVKSFVGGSTLDITQSWKAMERLFAAVETEPDETPSPLNLCLSGGRPMRASGSEIVSLLRPDMVPIVANALAELDVVAIQTRYDRLDVEFTSELSIDDVQQRVNDLALFYRDAAEQRSAIVFAAW